jgi:uncharacterized membrane protein YhaH (DUF805 family)
MAEQFKIVFEGQLRPGVDLETARLNLARLFKSDVQAIDRLFTGKPMTVKRGLNRDDAQRYLQILNDAGVQARIEPEQPVAWSLEELDAPATPKPPIEPAASPYAPPQASVASNWPEVGELKVFSIHGRIGRLRYLAWSMVLMFVALMLGTLCFGIMSMSLVAGGLLGTVALVAFFVISIQIGAQRLHDAGWSAWLLLLNLVPVVGSFFPILMIVIPGNSGANQYGAPPPANSKTVKILATLWLPVFALVFVGALTGGLQKVQDKVEATTGAYEQTLPYDDDSDDATPPANPVDPADPGDSSDNDEDQ